MNVSKTRIIIVSNNQKLKDVTSSGLGIVNRVESILYAINIVFASNYLNKFLNNIIILDMEKQNITAGYLKFLKEKFNLTVIIVKDKQPIDFTITKENKENIIEKPNFLNPIQSKEYIEQIKQRIKAFDSINNFNLFDVMNNTINESQKIITIASSTGGTTALEYIFSKLPAMIPPTIIVQHMPPGFTRFFADSLNGKSASTVVEAKHGDYIKKNTVYIAPAGQHIYLIKRNSKLAVECKEGPKLHGVCPAADILFNSIAPIMKSNAIGVILTGMGEDGARGLLEMRRKGARTIGQDEKSCVVYGMPKVAYNIQAVETQLPLEEIPEAILKLV